MRRARDVNLDGLANEFTAEIAENAEKEPYIEFFLCALSVLCGKKVFVFGGVYGARRSLW